jgi:pimeloyl-ACP methyl ester carboxylesterase
MPIYLVSNAPLGGSSTYFWEKYRAVAVDHPGFLRSQRSRRRRADVSVFSESAAAWRLALG